MKIFILLCLLSALSFRGGTQSFLPGVLMFQLKGDIQPNRLNLKQSDPNQFSLLEKITDYPFLETIFQDAGVTKLERPSYFTMKPSLMNIYRIYFTDDAHINSYLNQLQKVADVLYAEKEPIYSTGFIPNDPSHTGTNKWYHTLVGSENAWNITQGRTQVKIAIVDNAVFSTHNDLTAFKQYDVADNDNNAAPPIAHAQDQGWSHGTHCAGLATADINNGVGIAGLGGNVELIGVKCTPNSASSSGSVWYGYAGVQWACENGAHVVSMSFGGTSPSQAFQNLINAYPNVVFLAAAGNSNVTTLHYPGAYNNVICVGSVDANDQRSSFSNYNGATPYVDIAAPGGYSNGGLLSTVYSATGNTYAKMGGTSMATPFAAGLVGLMLSVNPTLTPAQVLSCLVSSGVNINQNMGPRIDALAAVQCASQGLVAGAPVANFFAIPTTIFEGDSVLFYENCATGGNNITSYQWSFPGGTPATFSGMNPPHITYNTSGTYAVTLTVTNSQTSDSETKNAYITVNEPPYGNWIVQHSGFSAANRGVHWISIVDQNVVWATAYDGSGANANVQQFTKTTDGGTTWTPGNINVGNAGLGISMVQGISSTTAWLAAYPNAAGQLGGIWKTTNGGSTWTKQTTATFSNAASFTNVVHFWDANEGFCMGDPINGEFEIYRTTNGGTNWTLVTGANIPNPLSGEYGYTRQMEVVGNSVWFSTNKGRIFHSTDKGATWAVYTSPILDFAGANISANFSFSSASTGYIVTNGGAVYKTTNAGSTWIQLATNGPIFSNGLCAIVNTNTLFTTGAATGGTGSSYSLDGGLTWALIDNQQHLYCEFLTPSIGWSGWFNTNATTNGMWKWNNLSSPLAVQFNGTPSTVCVNTPVQFSDQTTGGVINSWTWSFPGGSPSTSSIANPVVSYAQPGTYAVSLTVSDGINLSSFQDTAYITVETLPASPGVIQGNTAPCPNAVETYSVANDPSAYYIWTFPATWLGMSTTNSISLTMDNTPGVLSVSADNSCGSSAASTLTINLGALPIAGFSFNLNGGQLTLTNTSQNANGFDWDFGDGNTSTQTQPTHQFTTPGTYTVTLIATNACGQADTTVQEITVLDIEDLSAMGISVYPNPSAGKITLSGLAAYVGQELSIVDLQGRTVANYIIDTEVQVIEVMQAVNGLYLIRIQNGVLPLQLQR